MNHILYLGGFCLPNKNAAAQRVISNAKIFRELGYEVTLVGLSHNYHPSSFLFEGFLCVNLKYPSNFFGWAQMLFSIKQYKPYIKEGETKIVIAYNHPAVALSKLYNYCKKKDIKVLSDCTEWYLPNGQFIFKIIKKWDVDKRMYYVHPQLDGIITISRYLDDFYRNKGMKTLLLPPLVDKSESKWKEEKKEEEKDSENIKILYAGSPSMTKDRLDYIIESLQVLNNKGFKFVFDIIGITEKQYNSLYQKENIPSYSDFVKFHGRLTHEQVIKMLQKADFQIFLRENNVSTLAGFPTKFVETISAGTIVLTNASSNIKDYMFEGENSYELDISNKDTLVNSLITPLSLTKSELAKKSKNIDTYMFDYKNFIEQTKQFLKILNKNDI